MASPRSTQEDSDNPIFSSEILEHISLFSPGAFTGFALTSGSLFRQLITEKRYGDLIHTYLTTSPQRELNQLYEDFFWQHYKNGGLSALDKGFLDDITPENLDKTFALLEYAVDHHLEQLTKCLIARLRRPTLYGHYPNYFDEAKCYSLFSQQGLYSNNNLVLQDMLLNLISSLPKAAQRRILLRGCVMAIEPTNKSFHVSGNAVISRFWHLLPSEMREQCFFKESSSSDFITKLLENADEEYKPNLMHALLIYLMSNRFDDIQFLFASMENLPLPHLLKLALLTRGLTTFCSAPYFFGSTANSIRLLSTACAQTNQPEVSTLLCEAALALYTGGFAAVVEVPDLPPEFLHLFAINQGEFQSEPEVATQFLAGAVLSVMVAYPGTITLDACFALVRTATARRSTDEYLEFMIYLLKFALAANVNKEVLVHLFRKIPPNERVSFASDVFRSLFDSATDFSPQAVAQFLNVLKENSQFYFVLSDVIAHAVPDPANPVPDVFSMVHFGRALNYSAEFPWEEAMIGKLSRRKTLRYLKPFFRDLSGFACAQAAITYVIENAIATQNAAKIEHFLAMVELGHLPKKNRKHVVRWLGNLCYQLLMHKRLMIQEELLPPVERILRQFAPHELDTFVEMSLNRAALLSHSHVTTYLLSMPFVVLLLTPERIDRFNTETKLFTAINLFQLTTHIPEHVTLWRQPRDENNATALKAAFAKACALSSKSPIAELAALFVIELDQYARTKFKEVHAIERYQQFAVRFMVNALRVYLVGENHDRDFLIQLNKSMRPFSLMNENQENFQYVHQMGLQQLGQIFEKEKRNESSVPSFCTLLNNIFGYYQTLQMRPVDSARERRSTWPMGKQ